jgi:hypothetical protein
MHCLRHAERNGEGGGDAYQHKGDNVQRFK